MSSTAPQAGPSRLLTGLVIVMGMLIIAGVAVIVVTLISRHFQQVQHTPTRGTYSVLPIGAGARLEHVIPSKNGDLILQINAQNGEQKILVWDAETGVIKSRLTLNR